VSVEEVGLSSASLSAGLGWDGRVEVLGVASVVLVMVSALFVDSGSEKRYQLYSVALF
jgi:hypothetical protein